MTTIKGCLALILLSVLVGLFVVAGAASITRSFADWRMSANGATVVIQQTEQVRIQETEATKRTAIITDGNVEIARIHADVNKKTSFVFIGFFLVRALLWIGALLIVIVGALYFIDYWCHWR